jgi:serine/threonine-protein kinase
MSTSAVPPKQETCRHLPFGGAVGSLLAEVLSRGEPVKEESPAASGIVAGGTLLGRYEVLDRIGGGNFSAVFKGWDLLRRRPVAVKICNADTEDTRSRFEREARLAIALRHRFIVCVFEAEPYGAPPFLVEEFLGGEDLNRKISRADPSALSEKLRLLEQIAAGLAYAHRRGVAHRDIKPENIRVLPDGSVKIMDFGIAKFIGDESGITRPGIAIGSASHMSPEQIEGSPVDHRTDLFSWGVLAYELLSGRKPFVAGSLSELFQRIRREDPDSLLDGGMPPAVDGLVRRALAKNPAARPQSADEIRVSLQCLRIAGERPTRALASSPRRSSLT